MEWLAENWIWVSVAVVFIALHLSGRGCCGGGHGGHRRPSDKEEGEGKPTGS